MLDSYVALHYAKQIATVVPDLSLFLFNGIVVLYQCIVDELDGQLGQDLQQTALQQFLVD